MAILVKSVEIGRAEETGEDFDIAEVSLLASTEFGAFRFDVQVALNTGIDAAVDEARERLRNVCRQIAQEG
ncbi:hypothetical protein [Maricaulis sp. W15]|uniref:hypothetical protein n=1 Tax=Maricaulis sp. W15 TaxID=1772333 RepID=UPI00117D6516|nr:hypothetical protein [Maricaulis sp. W15]